MGAGRLRLVSALLALVGLVDAVYLTIVKWNFLADPHYDGGMCGKGGGCDELQRSAMAEIPFGSGPGIPISLLAVGFYIVWFLLLFLQKRLDDGAREGVPTDHRWGVVGRIMFGLALLANVYSLVLLSYSLSVGQFCPFCAIMYVANLGLAITTWLTWKESVTSFAKNAFAAVPTGVAGLSALTFVATVAAGFFVYRTTLAGTPRDKGPDPTTNPRAKVHSFQTAGRAERGPENAKIRIVEFADFECPHCRQLFHTLEEVMVAYPNDVHLTFMHFPLDKACNRDVPQDMHLRACDFAAIGECARQQGRFFQAADVLFDAGETERSALLSSIVGLGLDKAKFDQCLADPATLGAVKTDIEQGIKAGIQGTPAVYMNGIEVGGARPLDFFETVINRHLASTAPKP